MPRGGMRVRDDELTITNAAAILGRHRITIWTWCKTGHLAARRRGRHYFPKLAAVAARKQYEQRVARMLKAGAR